MQEARLLKEAETTLEKLQRRLTKIEEMRSKCHRSQTTAIAALDGRLLYLKNLVALAERRVERRRKLNEISG